MKTKEDYLKKKQYLRILYSVIYRIAFMTFLATLYNEFDQIFYLIEYFKFLSVNLCIKSIY